MKYMTEKLREKIGINEEDNVEDIMRELENSGVDVKTFDDFNIGLAEYECPEKGY